MRRRLTSQHAGGNVLGQLELLLLPQRAQFGEFLRDRELRHGRRQDGVDGGGVRLEVTVEEVADRRCEERVIRMSDHPEDRLPMVRLQSKRSHSHLHVLLTYRFVAERSYIFCIMIMRLHYCRR